MDSGGLDWQRRRSALNHDWLGQDLSNGLGGFLGRLKTNGVTLERLNEFLEGLFREWPAKEKEVLELIDTMPVILSPGRVLEERPFLDFPLAVRGFLQDLVIALWLRRYELEEDVVNARLRLQEVSEQYRGIAERLGAPGDRTVDELRRLAPRFEDLQEAFRDLSRALSDLPHRDYLP